MFSHTDETILKYTDMKKLALLSAAFLLSISLISAQPGKGIKDGNKYPNQHKTSLQSLNLNGDQKESIRDLRLDFSKNTLDTKNELRELSSKYRTLTSGENQNLDQIDKNIEQRQELRTKLMKEKVRMQMDVRKVLTEDQRIILDSKQGMKQGHKAMGPKRRNT